MASPQRGADQHSSPSGEEEATGSDVDSGSLKDHALELSSQPDGQTTEEVPMELDNAGDASLSASQPELISTGLLKDISDIDQLNAQVAQAESESLADNLLSLSVGSSVQTSGHIPGSELMARRGETGSTTAEESQTGQERRSVFDSAEEQQRIEAAYEEMLNLYAKETDEAKELLGQKVRSEECKASKKPAKAASSEDLTSSVPSAPSGAGTSSKKAKGGKKSKNCLLYTSPSPRDLSTSRMPSSA